jgi:hypothetical protein
MGTFRQRRLQPNAVVRSMVAIELITDIPLMRWE